MSRQSLTNKLPPPSIPVKEQIREILKKHDVNNDGFLCWEELNTAFKDLGAWSPWFRAYCGLHYADANNDGVINKDELDDVITYIINLGYKLK
ncbi:hypothetical protein Pint_07190 [Pistacia integerrima]|uniref:Uncharacterized protein n=1 Tax=Pistacia integerrima TaxID=434235 RepID=A0ACC0Y0D0_9ROSI|nr:hypothetical protein Pint_07190 [Pistacia integerrima]